MVRVTMFSVTCGGDLTVAEEWSIVSGILASIKLPIVDEFELDFDQTQTLDGKVVELMDRLSDGEVSEAFKPRRDTVMALLREIRNLCYSAMVNKSGLSWFTVWRY